MLFVCVICSVIILDSSSTYKQEVYTRILYHNDDDGDGLIISKHTSHRSEFNIPRYLQTQGTKIDVKSKPFLTYSA